MQKTAYLGLFLLANSLQLYDHQLTLLKRVANYCLSPLLRDDRLEIKTIISAIQVHVQEYVFAYKYKSNKSSKYLDCLQEAFPANPYQVSHNIQKYTFSLKKTPFKHLLLCHCLNLIFFSNFARFLDMACCPSVVQTCLSQSRHRQLKACLSLSNVFSPEETVRLIQ